MEMEKLKEDEPEWGGVTHNKTRNGDWKLETYGNNLWLLNIAMEAMAHFDPFCSMCYPLNMLNFLSKQNNITRGWAS